MRLAPDMRHQKRACSGASNDGLLLARLAQRVAREVADKFVRSRLQLPVSCAVNHSNTLAASTHALVPGMGVSAVPAHSTRCMKMSCVAGRRQGHAHSTNDALGVLGQEAGELGQRLLGQAGVLAGGHRLTTVTCHIALNGAHAWSSFDSTTSGCRSERSASCSAVSSPYSSGLRMAGQMKRRK